MKTEKYARRLGIILCLMIFASPSFADIGVPMIFVTFPYILIALIPIILIEAVILSRMLKVTGYLGTKCSALSNLISTLLGIPLAWWVLLIIQFITGGTIGWGIDSWFQKFLAVTWQSPWLIPYAYDFRWMIPAANAVLLIPFFFASWFIEYKVSEWYLRKTADISSQDIKKAVFYGNLITYGLLEVFAIAFLVCSLLKCSFLEPWFFG